jgi:hypothetical protein
MQKSSLLLPSAVAAAAASATVGSRVTAATMEAARAVHRHHIGRLLTGAVPDAPAEPASAHLATNNRR